MLEVKNLLRTFGSDGSKVTAVNGISFKVEDNAFVSIIGKSGSGKSTLLSLLGALDKPTSGSIVVDGTDIAQLKDHSLIKYRCNKIGFVFQSYNLIPNLTALENVMLPMEFAKSSRFNRKKRVAIARALANSPKLILADEPTGNLDSENGKMIFDLLHKLSKTENTTIIVVTHDLTIAGKTDRSFKLSDGKLIK